jgi:iron complex transport system ATP-binding protein
VLEFRDVSVAFGRHQIVRNLSAAIAGGMLTAVIGPNGAGKSTLFKAAAGLLPSTGIVELHGRALAQRDRQNAVVYMAQDIAAASSLTLLEVILLGRVRSLGLSVSRALVAEAEAALERFGLASLQTRTLAEVSGGQRQLAFLAQALFRQPQALLLDEPTAALDLRHQLVVLETVGQYARDHGISVAIAMHDLSLAAQFAGHIICLSRGAVDAAGPPSTVLNPERLRRLYGVEAEVWQTGSGYWQVMPRRAV